MYEPNTWQDQIIDGANRFTDQNGNLWVFTPAPVSITQPGTPFSADWMNHMEQGIAGIYSYGTSLPSTGEEGQLFFLIG